MPTWLLVKAFVDLALVKAFAELARVKAFFLAYKQLLSRCVFKCWGGKADQSFSIRVLIPCGSPILMISAKPNSLRSVPKYCLIKE